jgi:hypothetical protein
MTNVDQTLSAQSVQQRFSTLVAHNDGNLETTLSQLGVPAQELPQAKAELQQLLDGGPDVMAKLKQQIAQAEPGAAMKTVPGGVTKLTFNKIIFVPFAANFYVSHELVDKGLDVSAFVATATAVCGPEVAPFAGVVALGAAALKLVDRGNGIIATFVPPMANPLIPPIPRPQ